MANAKKSGYSESQLTWIGMLSRKKFEIWLPIMLSKYALHARAMLAVPGEGGGEKSQESDENCGTGINSS